MREIKFKIWDEYKEEMRYIGDLEEIHLSQDEIDFANCEILQYTGLKDKNGVEIYEGDLVETINFDRLRVEWDYDRWGLFDGICNEEDFANASEIKVIGNIYENKELIK